jgi:hypothetical protein
MKLRTLIATTLLLAAGTSNAAIINASGTTVTDSGSDLAWDINSEGRITGAFNIDVVGTLYDLVISSGTVNDAISTQVATTQAEATNFANAIIGQLLVDTSFGMFDADFTLVEGCQDSIASRCGISTLFFAGTIVDEFFGSSYDQANFMAARSVNGDADQFGNQEIASFNGYGLPTWSDKNLADNFAVIANWSLASERSGGDSVAVSAPATLGLMLLGAGVMFTRRRKA